MKMQARYIRNISQVETSKSNFLAILCQARAWKRTPRIARAMPMEKMDRFTCARLLMTSWKPTWYR